MTETKHTRKELYDAANMLRENCDKAKSCLDCDFFKNSWGGCALSQTPADWRAFKESPWSAADIMMAKALKECGFTHIRRNGNEILRNSFLNADANKVYSLDDIIAEGAGTEAATDGNTECESAQPTPTLTAQQLDLSDIEIQLLKICKQLGYDRIEKHKEFGNKFTIVLGSENYCIWWMPDAWNDDNELFQQIDVGESLKIDDIDGI